MTHLKDIAARLEAATPGPWHAVRNFSAASVRAADPYTRLGFHLVAQVPRRGADRPIGDAELIAHAPADLAALLGMLKAVRELHQPRTVYANETHCPRRLDTEHTATRHREDWTGFWVCEDQPIGHDCQTCTSDEGAPADWPCPTVAMIDS